MANVQSRVTSWATVAIYKCCFSFTSETIHCWHAVYYSERHYKISFIILALHVPHSTCRAVITCKYMNPKVFMNYLETIFSHNKRIWKISVYRCCFSFMKWDNSLLIVRYNKPSLIQSDIPWFQFCRSQLRDCNIPSGCRYIRVSNSTCSEWLPVQNSLLKSAILSSHRLRHVWIVHLWWPHCDEDGC